MADCGDSSCSAQCMDGCSSCEGGCQDGDCGITCTGTCDGGCENCGNSCGIGCADSCVMGCEGQCEDYCALDCSGGCDGGCNDYCAIGCSGSCDGSCDDTCDSTCEGFCDNGCTSANSSTIIANLGANFIKGNKVNSNDFLSLRNAIRGELLRRGKTVPSDTYDITPTSSGIIPREHLDKVLLDVKVMDVQKGTIGRATSVSLTGLSTYIKTLMVENTK